jgi:hypothetical protein
MQVYDYSGIEKLIVKYYPGYDWNINSIGMSESHWLSILNNSGSDKLSTESANFLCECIKTFPKIRDIIVYTDPVTIGTYKLEIFYDDTVNYNIPEIINFNVSTFSKSYICFNIFDNNIHRAFKFIPVNTMNLLIKNKQISCIGDFEWECGNESIGNYKKMLII